MKLSKEFVIRRRARQAALKLRKGKKCLDCGVIIKPTSIRCYPCMSLNRTKLRAPAPICIDCGTILAQQNAYKNVKRCKECFYATRRTRVRIHCKDCGVELHRNAQYQKEKRCVECRNKFNKDMGPVRRTWWKHAKLYLRINLKWKALPLDLQECWTVLYKVTRELGKTIDLKRL